MRLRGVRRRRAADRGFVLSDHADWDGLNPPSPRPGRKISLSPTATPISSARWLSEQGYDAAVVPTEFEGESEPDAEGTA
jgi:putative mRNA 3-end processing factor